MMKLTITINNTNTHNIREYFLKEQRDQYKKKKSLFFCTYLCIFLLFFFCRQFDLCYAVGLAMMLAFAYQNIISENQYIPTIQKQHYFLISIAAVSDTNFISCLHITPIVSWLAAARFRNLWNALNGNPGVFPRSPSRSRYTARAQYSL